MNTILKARVGRPTDTAKRERLLEALKGDPREYLEIGVPPYSVGYLTKRLEVDPSNLRKDLLKLEAEGFAVSEYHKVPTRNAISRQHMDRKCLCFWNAAKALRGGLTPENRYQRPKIVTDQMLTSAAELRSEGHTWQIVANSLGVGLSAIKWSYQKMLLQGATAATAA
jgi:hypothetical protein